MKVLAVQEKVTHLIVKSTQLLLPELIYQDPKDNWEKNEIMFLKYLFLAFNLMWFQLTNILVSLIQFLFILSNKIVIIHYLKWKFFFSFPIVFPKILPKLLSENAYISTHDHFLTQILIKFVDPCIVSPCLWDSGSSGRQLGELEYSGGLRRNAHCWLS